MSPPRERLQPQTELDRHRADATKEVYYKITQAAVGPAVVSTFMDQHPDLDPDTTTAREMFTLMQERINELQRQHEDLAGAPVDMIGLEVDL